MSQGHQQTVRDFTVDKVEVSTMNWLVMSNLLRKFVGQPNTEETRQAIVQEVQDFAERCKRALKMQITAFRLDWPQGGVGMPRFFGIDDVARLALLLETWHLAGTAMPTVVPLFSENQSCVDITKCGFTRAQLIQQLQNVRPAAEYPETLRIDPQ